MKCLSVSFCSFRNLERDTVSFSEGTNVIWGKNAQGKSNILEGIYFFARGRSFRGAKEKEMIRFGEKSSLLELSYIKDGDTFPTSLGCELHSEGRKVLTKNGARLSGAKEMIGKFKSVLFCPAHLALVSGGPSLRRSFLDIALSQLYPAYLDSLSSYSRALLQRNALIKRSSFSCPTDPLIWETYAMQLSRTGADIAVRRMKYMKELNCNVTEIFDSMTDGRERPSLTYRSSCLSDGEEGEDTKELIEKKLFASLTDNIDREIQLGSTLFGIHRDDIQVRLNSKDAKAYASQGQQRSLALAMKLSEGELSRKICGEYPVFLLDDVLSELDIHRRRFLLSNLTDRQLIVTSCEPDIFTQGGADISLIQIEDGHLIK